MPLPEWLRGQLFFLRCSLSWLMHSAPLSFVRQFSQLRHLDLQVPTEVATSVSATELRQSLAPLSLQTLLLSHSSSDDAPLPRELVAALTKPSRAQGSPPLLAHWSASLTHLCIEMRYDDAAALLATAAACRWPLL